MHGLNKLAKDFGAYRSKHLRFLALLVLGFVAAISTAQSVRIKDIATIQGVRSNPLIGYGLVVGLNGTGEQSAYTSQAFSTMLQRFGITLPEGVNPNIKNVAAVAVNAELPPFVKPGQQIDVTVSSLGNAKSLHGGTLLMTPLRGVDGEVYAIAQGNLVVGGFGAAGVDGSSITINTPTAGRVPNGATVEREVPAAFQNGDHLVLNLHRADFTSAKRLAEVINHTVGPNTARPMDAGSVKVSAPRDPAQRVVFMSALENLQMQPGEAAARIVINSRTGTIVVGQHVHLREAAVTHGNLVVTITEGVNVSQPNPLAGGNTVVTPETNLDVALPDSRMFHFTPGASLEDLVRAVNAVGAAPGDLMAILEALKQAGAIDGELVVI